MKFLNGLSFVNKGQGFSTSELRQFIEDSKNSETGMDEIFGDSAVATRLIEQLLDKLEPVQSGQYILKRKELGKVICVGDTSYQRVSVTLDEQAIGSDQLVDEDFVLDLTIVQTDLDKTCVFTSGEDTDLELIEALSLFVGMKVTVV